MECEVMWRAWAGEGLEHARVLESRSAVFLDGVVLGEREGRPFRLSYALRCDAGWTLRTATLDLLDGESLPLKLFSDGEGTWTDERGGPYAELQGCTDLAIDVTPLTHAIPIRRLALGAGESAELRVACVEVPSLRLAAHERRYECLAPDRYVIAAGDYRAEVSVDEHGLVEDEPPMRRRVWPVRGPVLTPRAAG